MGNRFRAGRTGPTERAPSLTLRRAHRHTVRPLARSHSPLHHHHRLLSPSNPLRLSSRLPSTTVSDNVHHRRALPRLRPVLRSDGMYGRHRIHLHRCRVSTSLPGPPLCPSASILGHRLDDPLGVWACTDVQLRNGQVWCRNLSHGCPPTGSHDEVYRPSHYGRYHCHCEYPLTSSIPSGRTAPAIALPPPAWLTHSTVSLCPS